jgi:hypothetical protein
MNCVVCGRRIRRISNLYCTRRCKIIAGQRRYRQKHADQIAARWKEYYELHRDELCEKRRLWREYHPEHIKKYNREYRERMKA